MVPKNSFKLRVGVVILLFLIITPFVANVVVWAWTEPTQPAPKESAVLPLTVSGIGQTKTGNLTLPNLYLNAVGSEGSIYSVNQVIGFNDLVFYGNSLKTAPIYLEGGSVVINNDAGTGNVGIGTTNPGYKLQVGNVGDGSQARANAWNILSDIRLKTNLTKLTGALDKISQMDGYYFNWNVGTDKKRQVGVIAQEVEKVLPEVVSEDSEGIKSVEYGKLSPLVIEAIKELKVENDALKARIEVLEAKLNVGQLAP